MKKADIRTQATLNIHDRRMKELMDAPENMKKTDASAAAFREIKNGVWKKEINAEAKRLDRRINFRKAAENVERINAAADKANVPEIICAFCDRKVAPGEAVKNISGRIVHGECVADEIRIDRQAETIEALKRIIESKDAEIDRLMERNNAGAEEVNELRRDLRKAQDLAADLAGQKEDLKRQAELFRRLIDAKDRTAKELIREIKDLNRVIEDLKIYKRVAEDKIEAQRKEIAELNDRLEDVSDNFDRIKANFDLYRTAEGIKDLRDESFAKLKVIVAEESIRRIKADFERRGVEIEW